MKPLNRRHFLRGALGTAVALPALEIMLDGNGEALASGVALCKRYLVAFGGHSLGADDDPLHNEYVPTVIGPGYDLRRATATLANHDYVADHITLVTGLRMPYDSGDGIPPGGWCINFHIQALGPLISGVRNKDIDDHGVNGPTSDQIVADAIGQDSVFPSLAYQVQAAWYRATGAPYGRDQISWRRRGDQMVPLLPQASPRAAYNQLFTTFMPADDALAAKKAEELLKRRSVIDVVRRDYDRLRKRLGVVDRRRMDRHFEEIQSLERILDSEPPTQTGNCTLLPDPGDDPPVGGAQLVKGGAQYDTNLGWSDENARARVFCDLIHMAFACDLTRSASLLISMAQSHMNAESYTGHPYDQHELNHGDEGTTAVSDVTAWHLNKFGYLVSRMRDTPEGNGTLLDNCAMVLLNEGGHGFSPGGDKELSGHSTENMACAVAGGAGGLVQGEHIPAEGYHPCNVLNTLMKAVGVDEEMGEVEGTIPGLLR